MHAYNFIYSSVVHEIDIIKAFVYSCTLLTTFTFVYCSHMREQAVVIYSLFVNVSFLYSNNAAHGVFCLSCSSAAAAVSVMSFFFYF